jgi:hypothetical protein
MPVVTRRRSVQILLVAAAALSLLLAGGAAVLSIVLGQHCTACGVGDSPSRAAESDPRCRPVAHSGRR